MHCGRENRAMRNIWDSIARYLMTYAFPRDYVSHPEPDDPRKVEIERWYDIQSKIIHQKYAQLHDAQVFEQNKELDALYFELRRRLAALEVGGK